LRNSRLAFRVSDGELESETKILRITATALTLTFKHPNKRAVVVQGSYLVLDNTFLKAETNAMKMVNLEITYTVTREPQYGTNAIVYHTHGTGISK
jgi:hypothetical protein